MKGHVILIRSVKIKMNYSKLVFWYIYLCLWNDPHLLHHPFLRINSISCQDFVAFIGADNHLGSVARTIAFWCYNVDHQNILRSTNHHYDNYNTQRSYRHEALYYRLYMRKGLLLKQIAQVRSSRRSRSKMPGRRWRLRLFLCRTKIILSKYSRYD